MALLRAARPAAPRMGRPNGGKNREFRTVLNYTSSFTTTAATDYVGVISIRPSNSSEYATLANIYDEIIVDGGRLDFSLSPVTTYTTNNGALRAVVAFDPIESAALSSLSNGLIHSQHFQFANAAALNGGTIQTPLATNAHGYFTFKWRTPKGVARSTSATAAFGHEWSSTSDTASDYGYLKWYIPVPGATGTSTGYWTWTLNVRYRART
jgi:hypothetical protein